MISAHGARTAARKQAAGAIRVLQDAHEYMEARGRLRAMGRDVGRQWRERFSYTVKNRRLLRVDTRKSWEVAWFAEVLEAAIGRDETIIDVGGVHSELPWVLHLAGFRHVHSCDVDPKVLRMPFGRHITYHVGPLASIDAADGTVGAITAVSTLEHGVDVEHFFRTVARLLRPGGLLCLSTDYWPTKIDTSDVIIFNLPWTIFDSREARDLIAGALDAGLTTLDGRREIPSAAEPCIHFNGRSYTFLAAILTKAADR